MLAQNELLCATMKRYLIFSAISALVFSFYSAKAINISEGKSVTLNGNFFRNGWGTGERGTAASLTDGVFLPDEGWTSERTVWWNMRPDAGNSIVIDLAGEYLISQFTVQVGANNGYRIETWDGANWQVGWDVPIVNEARMRTYTSGALNLTTSMLRFTGTGGVGWYAVSEIQAEGRAIQGVPEVGSTLGLLAVGLTSLGFLGRKRQ
ncbi:MAG TPA: hypothetical protein VK327_18925 [Candidatus Paceibacterota bacterium]|nr:hypothetical protein [Candidatus Paceibacterota bacterium]